MSFPKYPAYKDSGVEWLGEVPSHWSVTSLKWLAEQVTDKANTSDFQVGLENIQGWTGRLIETGTEFSGDGIAFISGDILFGKLRPYLAKVWFSDRAGQAVGDFFVLRPSSVKGEFLHKYILTPTVINDLNASTIGAKMPRVGWEDMAALAVTLPSPHEQTQIARFLDHETARIDTLIEEQQRLIELLKEKRQAVISHAVTKGLDPTVPMKDSGVEWLGEVPEHWRLIKLGLLASDRCDGPFGSALKSEHYTDEGVRVIRLQNIKAGWFNGSDAAYLDPDYYRENIGKSDVIAGDLLVAGLGDDNNPVGRACVAPTGVAPAMVKADCFRFRLMPGVVADFIAHQLTAGAKADGGILSTGSTRVRVPLSRMSTRMVALPPTSEQQSIAVFVERLDKNVDSLFREAQSAIDLLQERRSALISAAVTGKIDVRNWQPTASAQAPEAEQEAV